MPLQSFDFAIDRTISPQDTMMVTGRETQYFEIGHRALELVEFAANLCHKPHFPRILDFGCSFARVLRWIRPQHHYAEITACDLDQSAIDFCANHWAALPLLAFTDVDKIHFLNQFDLIWCGSVLTHLPEPYWVKTLDLLIDQTAECGVLIITLQGRYFASALANGQKYVADDVDQATLLNDFKKSGFGYQAYFGQPKDQDYGIALSSPQWVMKQLESRSDVIVRAYLEEAWGMQDVLILYKAKNYFANVA